MSYNHKNHFEYPANYQSSHYEYCFAYAAYYNNFNHLSFWQFSVFSWPLVPKGTVKYFYCIDLSSRVSKPINYGTREKKITKLFKCADVPLPILCYRRFMKIMSPGPSSCEGFGFIKYNAFLHCNLPEPYNSFTNIKLRYIRQLQLLFSRPSFSKSFTQLFKQILTLFSNIF